MDANIRKHWNDPVCIQRVLFILVITLIGTFIYAAGLNIFLVPHHFLAGGVTGIAMILYYLMDIPIGLSNLVLNIPVLILSLKFMGKFYTVVTILSTVSLSLFIDLTAFMADLSCRCSSSAARWRRCRSRGQSRWMRPARGARSGPCQRTG